MKKFIIHTVAFLGIFILVFGLLAVGSIYWVGNQYEKNYQASLIDKVERLDSITEPKIILVGNSNLSFGVRSELLEKAFNMPVVNLGLHGGLGNRFHENIAKLNIASGDIVIICHTDYEDDSSLSDPSLAWITLEHHRELWDILDERDYADMVKAFPSYLFDAYLLKITGTGNEASDDCYSRDAFNEYGDNIFANGKTDRYTFTSMLHVPTISEICTSRINELNEYITQKGATLLIGGYAIADGEFTPDHALYKAFEMRLRESVDCPVISSCEDYFFPYDYFYDTEYHLTEEGAIMRTNQLIRDLKAYLSE